MRSASEDVDRLRITHGAYWFATATLHLVNEQVKRHDVTLITTQKAVKWIVEEGWRELYDPRVHLRVERDRRRRDLLYYADRLVGVWRGMLRFKPDVLHLQQPSDHFLNHLFVRSDRFPTVVTVHDPVPHMGEKMGRYDKLEPLNFALQKRADWIIVHGQGVKDQLMEANPSLDPDRISVVLLGAWQYLLTWKRPEYQERPKSVLFFGRINAYKGLGVLLDAWQHVKAASPEARLVVAGTGYDLPNHRDRILADPTCELLDRVLPTPEVSRLFAEASIVVMPYVEGTQSGPLSVSVAFGKPVVVTNVGGLPEMVDENRSGFIVPPRDPEALADAIVRLLEDEPLRQKMAQGAMALSEGRLSPATLAQETEDVYRRAIDFHKSKQAS